MLKEEKKIGKKMFLQKKKWNKKLKYEKNWELHLQNVTTIQKVWPQNWHKIEKTG